jgi:RNA polymerase sigma-70 factor, ECF subfamily
MTHFSATPSRGRQRPLAASQGCILCNSRPSRSRRLRARKTCETRIIGTKSTTTTEQATKALLHRGRTRLRELGALRDVEPHPPISEETRALVNRYVDRFNARDFDAVRDLLADEVRVEVVRRARLEGRGEVADNYLHNSASTHDWHFVAGSVDGRAAMIAISADRVPQYFVLLRCEGGQVAHARDFRYAAYVLDGAVIELA